MAAGVGWAGVLTYSLIVRNDSLWFQRALFRIGSRLPCDHVPFLCL